jgi:ATP dependent DNA ligase domain
VSAKRRKATLSSVVAKAGAGIRFNEHIEADGPTVFAHACKLGLEGIVSKRKDSPYRSGGRSPDWLKMKNPNAPAVRREAEEDQLELVPSWFSPRNLPPLLLRFGSIVRCSKRGVMRSGASPSLRRGSPVPLPPSHTCRRPPSWSRNSYDRQSGKSWK